MTITATITMGRHTSTVTWADGILRGDAATCAYIRALAAHCEGIEVGSPNVPTTTTNHLASAQGFLALCALASDRYPQFTGDKPDLPPSPTTPEGVIV